MDGLNLKLGRQLWPVLISSEYQRVHYLLPQANIPATTYRLLPFISFDGFSVNKSFETAVGSLTASNYAGNPKLNAGAIPGVDMNFQTMSGARLTLDGSGWRLHATANKLFSKVTIDSSSYLQNGTAIRTTGNAKTESNIFSFGYKFDKHNFVTWGEATINKADIANLALTTKAGTTTIASSSAKLFEKSYGGYVLAGYRIGKYLPTLTYSQGTTYLGLPASANNSKYEGKTSSYIAGLTYQMNDQATIRTEYLRTYVPSVAGGWYDVTQSTTSTKRFGDAVKAGVDFIF